MMLFMKEKDQDINQYLDENNLEWVKAWKQA